MWADVREQLVEDLGELFAQRFDALPDDYKPSFIDVLAFLRGDTLAPEMTAMNVAESRMERDALLAVVPLIEDAHRLLAKVVPADQNDMIRWAVKSGDGTYTNAGAAYRRLVEALAALPEHLKAP